MPLAFDASPGAGGRSLLSLRTGHAAGVKRLEAEVRLDAKPPRARSRARLLLDAAPRVALLSVDGGAAFRLPQASEAGGVTLTPIARMLDDPGMGAVRIEWHGSAPRGVVVIETEVPLAARDVKDGIIALLHQSQAIPFAESGHFTFELVLDVPLPNLSVSVGKAEDLPADEGRRRTRWSSERAVDYLPLAAGPFVVASLGEGDERLELWRTRQVGGDSEVLLKELRELVDHQAALIAPLPYRAFRLVELPTLEGLAVSYPSLIFMTPGLLATREQREEILSHEVGHQWWGNAVSPDLTARWSSEGMADAMKDLFVRRRFGEQRWLDRQDAHRKATLGNLGAGSRPLAGAPGGMDAYHRGALFVHALHADLGDELFWRVLRRWYERLAPVSPRTADFLREAEAEAGRSLAFLFDPWLGSTALPVISHEWTNEGRVVSVTLRQEEPHFPLDVPLRAAGADGAIETWTLRLTGAEASGTHELPFEPIAVDLDPGQLLPRVLDAERAGYWRAEAAASLARGDAGRARGLLERAAGTGLLDPDASIHLFAARVLSGVPAETARRDLDVVLAEMPSDARRQEKLLQAATNLLEQGAPAAALPLVMALDAEVPDGATIPHLLGLALRALGREPEARAAFERAVSRRPDHASARAALGLPPAAMSATLANAATATLTPILPADHALLKTSSPEGTRVVALEGHRAAILLTGARALLTGRPGEMSRLDGFSPVGAVDLALLDTSAAPLLAVLESARLRSRLTLIELAAAGAPRIVAVHERLPGGAKQLLVSPSGGLLAGWEGTEGTWTWARFTGDLRRSSAGPDDDEGLRRITLALDARWTVVASALAPPSGITGSSAALLVLGSAEAIASARDDRARLATEDETAWESLDGDDQILSVRPFRNGIAILFERSDAGSSPLAQDVRRERRLLAIAGDILVDREVPSETLDFSLATDGGLALELAPVDEDEPRLLWGRIELTAPAE